MSIGKKIFFCSFSIFLGYQSFHLLTQLFTSNPTELSFQEVVTVSFLLNLFITGIVAFPGFVFPTNKLIGQSYYRLKNTKRLKQIYTLLQVAIFRKLLLFFFWGRGKNRTKYFNGTRAGLKNFSYQSKQSEFGHLVAVVIISAVSIPLFIKGHFKLVIITSLINVIGNLYPIILQRHHRIRIEQIVK